MLKEKININAKVLYCGLECSLVEVISENRLKLEIPTVDAHRILFEAGKNAKKRKKQVDAVAASLILEGYLAFRRGGNQG